MTEWVVGFIESNKEILDKRRGEEIKERAEEQLYEEWRSMSREVKIDKLKQEEAEIRREPRSSRDDRLETALRLKEIWRARDL